MATKLSNTEIVQLLTDKISKNVQRVHKGHSEGISSIIRIHPTSPDYGIVYVLDGGYRYRKVYKNTPTVKYMAGMFDNIYFRTGDNSICVTSYANHSISMNTSCLLFLKNMEDVPANYGRVTHTYVFDLLLDSVLYKNVKLTAEDLSRYSQNVVCLVMEGQLILSAMFNPILSKAKSELKIDTEPVFSRLLENIPVGVPLTLEEIQQKDQVLSRLLINSAKCIPETLLKATEDQSQGNWHWIYTRCI